MIPTLELSAGAQLLRAFLTRNSITQVAAGKALGVSDVSVLDWARGRKRPNNHHRELISLWTSGEVPVESWLLDGEKAAVAVVRPFVPAAPESASNLESSSTDTDAA